MSLDGVMEAPGGEPGHRSSGWTFKDIELDPAAYELKGREQEEAGALLVGRTSYEAFAPVWPSMTEEFPGYNAMPRYVVSTTLEQTSRRRHSTCPSRSVSWSCSCAFSGCVISRPRSGSASGS